MDILACNIGMLFKQLQRLIEPRWIGCDIAEIGDGRQRQETVCKLIARNMPAITAFQMRLELRPAGETELAGKDELNVLQSDIVDVGKIGRNATARRSIAGLNRLEERLCLLFQGIECGVKRQRARGQNRPPSIYVRYPRPQTEKRCGSLVFYASGGPCPSRGSDAP